MAVIFVVAFASRSADGPDGWLMTAGAMFIAPPLAWAGYFFLRDDELEGYRGINLAVRTTICSLAYAGLWGVYWFLYPRLIGDTPFEIWNVFSLLPLLVVGAGAAYVCYDLELGNGFFHYSLYVVVTILLRMAAGLPALGPTAKQSADAVSWISSLVATTLPFG